VTLRGIGIFLLCARKMRMYICMSVHNLWTKQLEAFQPNLLVGDL